MKVITGGVSTASGFQASGLSCGIKRSGKPDLTLIYSKKEAQAAGVFTKNSVKAAPVVVTQNHLRNGKAQALIANSGNANCFTGHFGHIYAQAMSAIVGKLLNIPPKNVLVASTGIIGVPLPIRKIAKAVPKLVKGLSAQGNRSAAEGILTTDTVAKQTAVTLILNGKKVTIGGCAKGSGMVAPNMATMLGFITTDAAINAKMLRAALKKSVDDSFNCITIDGCMSTNDMVTVLANGLAQNRTITKADNDFKKFTAALRQVCLDLAKKIVNDGEGATKLVEIQVNGAKTKAQAKKIALTVANSVLVKTAAFGSNPNWGRVAQAVGSLGLKITEKNLKIKFSSFQKRDIKISIGLNLGKNEATVYTTDLSYEYVKINEEYN